MDATAAPDSRLRSSQSSMYDLATAAGRFPTSGFFHGPRHFGPAGGIAPVFKREG